MALRGFRDYGSGAATTGQPPSGGWPGRSNSMQPTPNPLATTATVAATPAAVVVAPVVASPSGNKTLLYVGLGLLAFMVLRKHSKA